MSRIVLTGGNGFIGTEFVNQLKVRGLEFISLVRSSVADSNESFGDFIICNFDDFHFESCINKGDIVVHLAAAAHGKGGNDKEIYHFNVDLTKRIANAAAKKGAHRFVFISSIGVNGTSTTDTPFSCESLLKPHNAYAMSKRDAELGLKAIADETRMELVIVRPTLVYGSNAPGNFGSLTKLVSKVPFLPFGLANNKRDFISVQNLADLLITCAEHPNAGGNTFLASDCETVSIKEFTNAIALGLNKTLIQLPVPVSVMLFAARLVSKSTTAEQLLGNLQVDSSNAQEVLDWVPPYTMEQAMASLSENKK